MGKGIQNTTKINSPKKYIYLQKMNNQAWVDWGGNRNLERQEFRKECNS